MQKLPSFLVIGDHKTGTSSIQEYLKQHPEVYMPRDIKELRFFAYDENNEYHARSSAYTVKQFDDYLSYFADVKDEKVVGEASPNYLRSPGTAERIKAKLPEVKLIVCLRNPADRLFSLYQMELRFSRETREFDEFAFGRDALIPKGSFYWQDLKKYYELFPRENIHVVIFDDLISDQVQTMQQVYAFLGISTDYVPVQEIYNKGGLPKNKLWYSLLQRLRKWTKSLGLGGSIKKMGKNMINKSLVAQKIPEKIKGQLLEVFAEDTLRTQELIERDLSMWLPKR